MSNIIWTTVKVYRKGNISQDENRNSRFNHNHDHYWISYHDVGRRLSSENGEDLCWKRG